MAVGRIRQTCASNQILDLIVAAERTGRYHQIVRDAFRSAGFDTRIVHPFAIKPFRQPADPGIPSTVTISQEQDGRM